MPIGPSRPATKACTCRSFSSWPQGSPDGGCSSHGPGDACNLFPITQQANTDHNNDVEEHVKDLVHDDRLVVMYGVNVDIVDGPNYVDVYPDGTCRYQYLDADFNCTYATYTLYTDDSWELNPVTNETIHSRFDVSGFIAGVDGKGCPQG